MLWLSCYYCPQVLNDVHSVSIIFSFLKLSTHTKLPTNFPQLSNLILIVFLFNYCLSVSSLLKQSSRKVLYPQLFKLICLLDLDNVIVILKVLSFILCMLCVNSLIFIILNWYLVCDSIYIWMMTKILSWVLCFTFVL